MRKVESFSGTGRSTNSENVESVDYFGTNKYLSGNFFDEVLNWSGVINFHCMQVILVLSTRFIFGDY